MTEGPEALPGCHLIALDTVGSTNEEARRLAEAGAADRTVVWAREQTAGRGRHGRSWASPPGNLYVSILLRPACPVAQAPQIGFAVGAAMADAIRALTGLPVALKWPNDLYLGGEKLSGILLESAGDVAGDTEWVVAGIGVNVAFRPDVPGAGCLNAAGAELQPSTLLESFVPRFFELLDVWSNEGFPPVRAAWEACALPLGSPLSVKLPGGTEAGGFAGIDETGNLLLDVAGNTVRVAVGDVFPLSTAATGA